MNYKYQKAQSEFLEVMRELSRFRGEFLDNCSLRSKLLKILDGQENITTIMRAKEEVLRDEIAKLDTFVGNSQELFDSKLVDFMASMRHQKKISGADSINDETLKNMRENQKKQSKWKINQMHVFAILKQKESHEKNKMLKDQAGLFEFSKPDVYTELEQLERQISDAQEERRYIAQLEAGDGGLVTTAGTRYKLIDGVKCFVKYKINKTARICDFWVYPKKYQEPVFVRVNNIDVASFRINL